MCQHILTLRLKVNIYLQVTLHLHVLYIHRLKACTVYSVQCMYSIQSMYNACKFNSMHVFYSMHVYSMQILCNTLF